MRSFPGGSGAAAGDFSVPGSEGRLGAHCVRHNAYREVSVRCFAPEDMDWTVSAVFGFCQRSPFLFVCETEVAL